MRREGRATKRRASNARSSQLLPRKRVPPFSYEKSAPPVEHRSSPRSPQSAQRSSVASVFSVADSDPLRALAGGDEEHDVLAAGVGREKLGDVVVEEGQAGGAEAEGIGGEIELA